MWILLTVYWKKALEIRWQDSAVSFELAVLHVSNRWQGRNFCGVVMEALEKHSEEAGQDPSQYEGREKGQRYSKITEQCGPSPLSVHGSGSDRLMHVRTLAHYMHIQNGKWIRNEPYPYSIHDMDTQKHADASEMYSGCTLHTWQQNHKVTSLIIKDKWARNEQMTPTNLQ